MPPARGWEGRGQLLGSGVHTGGEERPARERLDPYPSAVLTEDGQPCRFPFRYGGRMHHSCTSEGSAHRKWWVPVDGACKHRSPAALLPVPTAPRPLSHLPPSTLQTAWHPAGVLSECMSEQTRGRAPEPGGAL